MLSTTKNILRWSEAYTGTDMVYLASGSFWILVSRVVSTLAAFVLLYVFGNYVDPHDYGMYQFVIAIAGILAIPTLTGMTQAMTKAIASGYETTVFRGLKTRIQWGLLSGVGSVCLAGYYFYNGNIDLTIAFLVTAVFLPFMDSLTLYGSIFQGRKEFRSLGLLSSSIAITRVVILVATILITKNIFLIIFANFIAQTLLHALAFYIGSKRIQDTEIDGSAIGLGKHLSLMGILGTVATQLDKILMFHYLGAAQLAIYSIATAPVIRVSSVITPIVSVAYPKFAQADKEVLKKTLPGKLFRFMFITALVAGLYIVTVPYLYRFLFPLYLDSVIYSQVFALTLLFIPQKFIGSALTAHDQRKALYVVNTVNPIVKISLLFILLPLYGVMGAVIALLVPLALNTVMLTYFFRRL